MLAKLEKENTINLISESCDEIESFTLLHLTDAETLELLSVATDVNKQSNIITINMTEEVNNLWKKFAKNHNIYSGTPNVTLKYLIEGNINKNNPNPETSVLIRNPKTHIIVSGRRGKFDSKEMCHINKLYISNEIRNKWWEESLHSKLSHERAKMKNMFNQRFAVDLRDEELYNRWSKYMDRQYLKNTNQAQFIKTETK